MNTFAMYLLLSIFAYQSLQTLRLRIVCVNIDNSRYIANIFVDLNKAFDAADHGIVLANFRKYGIENLELT